MDLEKFQNLKMTNKEVLLLSDDDALLRLNLLIQEAYEIYNLGVQCHILDDKKELSNTCILFSGGNDSTVLFYLFKDIADFAIHVNTGIGISQTYDYVKNTCLNFNIPLKTYMSDDKDSYENLIIENGFPGPSQHFVMYQRLKERALRKAVKENNIPKKQRIVFLSGKRRDESSRRKDSPVFVRNRSVVWISPIVNWTKADINLYRKINKDIPRNPVSDMIHMSGECLCGSFAKRGEKDQLQFFFPDFVEYLNTLEEKVKCNNSIPDERKKWGWGSEKNIKHKANLQVGDLCSTCEFSNSTED